jgi:putative hydrolase of the HAD superfamily
MGFRACLLDVYETVLTCDYERMAAQIQEVAGIDGRLWHEVVGDLGPGVTDGRVSLSGLYAEVIRRSGAAGRDGFVQELVDRDHHLLRESARLYGDTVPLLERLRSRGVMTALVSNCAENTRPLLDDLGLIGLVDEVVLSCEVGAAKPEPTIYEHALSRLGVAAGEAVFVDDQPAYCVGAAALGLRALRLCRDPNDRPDGRVPSIASLTDVEHHFTA